MLVDALLISNVPLVYTTAHVSQHGLAAHVIPRNTAQPAQYLMLSTRAEGSRVLQALQSGIRRIDLGGKFMTNYLKELVSFRCLPA